MKKIVALVLSLVMVLGLATVAFGATAANGDLAAALAVTDSTAEVKAAAGAVPSAKTFATYQIYKTDKATSAITVEGPFAELATADGATWTYVDGTVIRYFAPAQTYTVNVKAVKIENKTAYDCGDLQVATTGTYYVDEAGKYYSADANGTVVGNLNGKMVLLADATVTKTPHAYVTETKTAADGTVTVTAVKCSVCKKSFAFVEGTEADAVAKFGAGKYEVVTAGTLYAAAAGSATAADDKVNSAETFDAGIAMYVGMSVMAAAGSAVVLKKKD